MNFEGGFRLKYSLILSTVGVRETMDECLSNFNWFVQKRRDTELVIGTTRPDFTTDMGRVYYFKQPIWLRKFFMYRQAAELASGEIVIFVADDLKLSKNFLDRCDGFFAHPETMMVQPALVDAEGFVILSEYIRSYTVGAVRRRLVKELNLGTHMSDDTEFVEKVRREYQVIFDNDSYALHYGYPVKGGVDAMIRPYNRNRARFDDWIHNQRLLNNHRMINLKETFA